MNLLFLEIIIGIILFLMFCTVVYLLGKIRGQAEKHSQFLAQIRDRLPEPEEEQEATEDNETRYGTKPPKKQVYQTWLHQTPRDKEIRLLR